MNTFNKVAIATVGALFTAQTANAQTIHNSCLTLSDQTAGVEQGQFVTNEAQLTGTQVTSGMRLHSIKTCQTSRFVIDSRERVTGLQFFMALNPYEAVGEETFAMDPIGPMTGDCETLELPEGLDSITVTLDESRAGLSVMYRIDGDVLDETYGKLDDEASTVWEFTEEAPLVGLYGRASDIEIEQLGFITLDTACQAAAEAPAPVDEEEEDDEEETEIVPADPISQPEEVTDPEEDLTDPETTGPEEEEEGGLPTMTIVFICAGIVGFLALLGVTLCAMRLKRNKLNRVDSPVRSSSKGVENGV